MLIRGIGSEKLGLEMWLPFDAKPSPVHEIIVIIQVQAGENLSAYLSASLSYQLVVKYKIWTLLISKPIS
jgi:hypothetical protein